MGLADDLRGMVVRAFYGADPPEGMRRVYSPDAAFIKAIVYEHWQFLQHFPRWCGAVMARAPHEDVWIYEVDNLHEELVHDEGAGSGHYQIMRDAAREVGWTEADLARGPGPKMARAIRDWWDICATRPWPEAMAAIHGTEMLADQRLKKHPEFRQPAIVSDSGFSASRGYGPAVQRWLNTTAADTAHAGRAAALVEKYAATDATEEGVRRTFARSMDDMRLYFEAVVDRRAEVLRHG
jgi:pyrroloquinoline-quinone synthase